jgi:hypothetical protein
MMQVLDVTGFSLTAPESDDLWIKWFACLKNVPMVTFIYPVELWLEMPVEQTVWVWTEFAHPDLRHIKFWSMIFDIRLTREDMVARVWVKRDVNKKNKRIQFSLTKDQMGGNIPLFEHLGGPVGIYLNQKL